MTEQTTTPTGPTDTLETTDPVLETREGDKKGWKIVAGLSLGLPIVIALMLFAFLAPTFGSGADELPVRVSGPEPAVEMLTGSLEEASPGAFDFTVADSADSVRQSILNRESVGGFVIDPQTQTLTIYTASGNGAPYTQMLSGIAQGMQAQGQNVQFEDLAPLTDEDPNGTGMAMLGLPLAFGGMISAALMTFTLRGRPWHKLVGSLAISVVAGFIVGAILTAGYGVLTGSYLAISLAIAAGVAATSLFVTGLGSLIGPPGVGVGAIITIFISNPLSGLSTGWWWLPSPWGAIGQYLPIGADGHLLRSIAFFDGAGSAHAIGVLVAWMVVGTILLILGGMKNTRDIAKEQAELPQG